LEFRIAVSFFTINLIPNTIIKMPPRKRTNAAVSEEGETIKKITSKRQKIVDSAVISESPADKEIIGNGKKVTIEHCKSW